ncbi:MAG: hypothetical protein ACREBW_05805, partial [Candidatus Micrarchaeaceae archaeon]
PKTGGMSFRGILEGLYKDSFIYSSASTLEGIERELKNHDCVEFHVNLQQGHAPYPHFELARHNRWDLLSDRLVFTMMRDPVEQACL